MKRRGTGRRWRFWDELGGGGKMESFFGGGFCSGSLSLSNLSLCHILELALRDLCGRNRGSSFCCVLSGDYPGVGERSRRTRIFCYRSPFSSRIPFIFPNTPPSKPHHLGFSSLSLFSDILPHNAMPISWSCFSTQRALGLVWLAQHS